MSKPCTAAVRGEAEARIPGAPGPASVLHTVNNAPSGRRQGPTAEFVFRMNSTCSSWCTHLCKWVHTHREKIKRERGGTFWKKLEWWGFGKRRGWRFEEHWYLEARSKGRTGASVGGVEKEGDFFSKIFDYKKRKRNEKEVEGSIF